MIIQRIVFLVVCAVALLSVCEAKPREKGTRRASKGKRGERTIDHDPAEDSSPGPRNRTKKGSRKGRESAAEGAAAQGSRKRRPKSGTTESRPTVSGKSTEWGFVFSWHQNRMHGYDKSDYRYI